mmetsp:Transcript_15734/g.43402  ORF Transcript_15734/g.43402 Transcript_15734/m.43402 type:complete len:515 (-) Transcript_15734:889-2433(-)
MSFSSRRRNYLLTPHRRDGLIEWMKSMLQHSFVLDALGSTAHDTFLHFEMLIEEHRRMDSECGQSRLQQLVPTIGRFHTPLHLCEAFEIYNRKHRLTKRKHIQISFNEIRHIMNLAQILALRSRVPGKGACQLMMSFRGEIPASDETPTTAILSEGDEALEFDDNGSSSASSSSSQLNAPKLITFDADQTLYKNEKDFEANPQLMQYLELLLRHGVLLAFCTSTEYGNQDRFASLFKYFEEQQLPQSACDNFYLFAAECNYLFQLNHEDYRLHPVNERGPGGWFITTQFLLDAPGNWKESNVEALLDAVQNESMQAMQDLCLDDRASIVRNRRSIGIVPNPGLELPRETLDEMVLCVEEQICGMNDSLGPGLPYSAYNSGSEVWVNVGNKRVGVQILQSYLGVQASESLHVGDQFVNEKATVGNAYFARTATPCIWVISPKETEYSLKTILRLAGNVDLPLLPPDSITCNGAGGSSMTSHHHGYHRQGALASPRLPPRKVISTPDSISESELAA